MPDIYLSSRGSKNTNGRLSLRINGKHPRSLAKGTGYTSKRKIGNIRLSALTSWNDMIDVKCRFLRTLRQQAVLTGFTSSVTYFLNQT